ncbi:MAG: DUF547 domain-containing protein [Candidatus Omnitrophica bacterium]|nr:DUF547 domain-containing protein [Candidatus Omnitrophota bacterium]
MRRLLLVCALAAAVECGLGGSFPSWAVDFDHSPFDRILRSYVVGGRVDYKGLQADRAALDVYVASLADVARSDYDSWDEPARIAFWINAYNAITLKVILDHYPITKRNLPVGLAFPVNSIRQIPGQWDKITHQIMGVPMTLNSIEHETLRKQFKEPGIHMALVCAAKGCPILRSEAYSGTRLADQLADQARSYLATPAGMEIDRDRKTVKLSSIFSWFGEDFVKAYGVPEKPAGFSGKKAAVLAYVARHVGPQDQEFLESGDYKLSFLSYDWSLNERE